MLHALHATGAGRHPEHEDWLVRAALNPQPGCALGFYDGLHGIAYVLDALGRRDEARALLDICLSELDGKQDRLGLSLFSGLAGIGLNLAHFAAASADSSLWEATLRVADIVAGRLGDVDSVGEISGGKHSYAGLTRGSSGPALLFLRLYERFGDDGLLDLAATAIRQDLRRCKLREDSGSLEVAEGWRTMPYIADGSVGIGMVIQDYLAHREDEQFADALPAIRRAADYGFYIYPNLLLGRAGMLLYHARSRAAGVPGPRRHDRRARAAAVVARPVLRGAPRLPRREAPAPVDGPRDRDCRGAARPGLRPARRARPPSLPRAGHAAAARTRS